MAHLPGMQLATVHTHLRKLLLPQTSHQIFTATGVDLTASPDLLASLISPSSKVRREPDGRWRWKSAHYLTCFNDLLQHFALAAEGVAEADLADAYAGVRHDIDKLKASRAVYALKNKSRIVLYKRDTRLEVAVSDDVKDAYRQVRLPDEVDVHRYLVNHRLKDEHNIIRDGDGGDAPNANRLVRAIVKRKRPGQGGKNKKKAGPNKRTKLTNTHMAGMSGVDLTKDYDHGKGGAFG